jgi:SSS family transporter
MTDTVRFGTLNYLVLVLYLLLLVWLGFSLSRRQRSTDDFFKGGHRIPWWAAGLSIFGTQLSAITFMAIPSKTFATNWLYFFLMMTILLVSPFIIRYFLPFYRRFNLTTAYEYLEFRFNLATRLTGSILYLILQVGRMGIVLLLPSLALSVVTGFDVHVCILTMGLLSILYTVLGGIEAVIWTDVLQVVVLLGGSLLSLLLLALSLDGSDVSGILEQYDKLHFLDLSPDLFQPTLWVVLLGGFASNIIQYGSDQTVIQRYLTTRDERSAADSIRTGAWLTLPATLIFFSLGTLLFVHYKVHPEMLNPTLQTTDAIFPWYIVSNLPDGVVGLLIAAIFAASMSSLDSSMNSAATVVTTDFYRRLQPARSEDAYLRLARRITLVTGALGTGLALLMATWGVSSLWDQFNMIVGLFAGGLGGVFLLGIFSRRANGTGAVIGLAASGVIQFLVKEHTPVHLLLYAFTGMVSAVAIGYLASLVAGRNQPRQQAFTYFAIRRLQKGHRTHPVDNHGEN